MESPTRLDARTMQGTKDKPQRTLDKWGRSIPGTKDLPKRAAKRRYI